MRCSIPPRILRDVEVRLGSQCVQSLKPIFCCSCVLFGLYSLSRVFSCFVIIPQRLNRPTLLVRHIIAPSGPHINIIHPCHGIASHQNTTSTLSLSPPQRADDEGKVLFPVLAQQERHM